MSLTGTSKIKDIGTVIEPVCNAAFAVDSDRVWIVLAGTLDLFSVAAGNSGSRPRLHILRIEAGRALFGFAPAPATGAALIANPGPDTRLACLDRSQLKDLADDTNSHPIIPLLEEWITALGMAAADVIPPKSFVRLEPGKEIVFDDGPGAVLSLNQLVWVRPVRGAAHLMGSDLVPPLDGQFYFPVTRDVWLACEPHSKLACIDSGGWLQCDPQWSGLHGFSDLIWSYLLVRRRADEQQERQRMLASAEADGQRVERAFLTLAAPLQKSAPEVQEIDSAADPLYGACEAIGRVAGITILPALGSLRGLKHKDPVTAIARASQVRVRRVLLRGEWWKGDNGPLLGFLAADNRPVALLPRSRRSYRAFDAALNASVNVTSEFAAQIKETAYVFYRAFPRRELTLKDLFAFALRGSARDLGTIAAMGVATGLLALLPPILTGIIFDDLIPGARRDALLPVTIFLIVSALAAALFALTRQYAVLRLEGKMDAATQAAVWDRTIALPVPFFRQYAAGDLAIRALVVGQIRQILLGSTLSSILSGVFSVTSFALLFYYSWHLALLATVLTAVAVLVFGGCGYSQVRYQREIAKLQGRISSMLLQFISGISKFRASGTESRVFARWAKEFARQKMLYLRVRKLTNALTVFNAAFPVIASAAIFYGAAYLLSSSSPIHLTSGQFLAFFAAFLQFLGAGIALSSAALSIPSIIPLVERAKPILNALPEVDTRKTDPGELSGHIEINHVVFRYGNNLPVVVNDVSLSISPGQFIAFVGVSGSGKSTLLRLLLGFEQPESGTIYLDGQELSGLDLHAVRRQFGVVLQNSRVLTGDIFSNIVGSATLTYEDAWEAARRAGLDRDIEAMPMGMHTMVSEAGSELSGGQRQRLMIARAIVTKPRILLFDEATSSLDNCTQAIVSRSLENLNATRIVIAHRLSTVINADRIFVLDKGRIVQAGNFSELIQQEGIFKILAKRQMS